MTAPKDIVDRHRRLTNDLQRYDHAYYVLNQPVVSDRKYDKLYQELLALEQSFPELVTSSSPSQRIGAEPLAAFRKVHRQSKMLSLNNTYSEEDIRAFHQRTQKLLNRTQVSYIVEPKIDGLGIECVYANGAFIQGSTRGDGLIGEDVTANLRTIRSIPLTLLHYPKNPQRIIIRGEVYIEKLQLAAVNRQRSKAGLPLFSNTRNAAAGSLRLLDARQTAQRPLRVIFYQLDQSVEPFTSQDQVLMAFRSWGLPTHDVFTVVDSIDGLLHHIGQWHKHKPDYAFDIDGLVIKANEFSDQILLGETAKYPRWAIAYKFEAEQGQTRVVDIRSQVGRTGVLTPVADLEPIFLSGSTVSHASLHNFSEVRKKDIRIGDTVVIEKAGEVIPQVVQVMTELRTGNERPLLLPQQCPECGSPVVNEDPQKVSLKCVNTLSCRAQMIERLLYFCSKAAVNIEGLGPAIINQLIEQGLVHTPADLFVINVDQLCNLSGFGKASAQNLISSIEAAKQQVTLERLLIGLGIAGVGTTTAQALARKIGGLSFFADRPREELEIAVADARGIGVKTAQDIAEFFDSASTKSLLHDLRTVGVWPMYQERKSVGKLTGKRFSITGTLKQSRASMKKAIEGAGGQWSNHISTTIDYLIVGESPGQAKLTAAAQLNIPTISEWEFTQMVGQ